MRMDKLTTQFQQALADAQSLAVGRDSAAIEPVHLALALLNLERSAVAPLLQNAGVDLNGLRSRLNQAVEALPRLGQATGDVNVSQELNRLLNLTDKLAQEKKDQFERAVPARRARRQGRARPRTEGFRRAQGNAVGCDRQAAQRRQGR
jgi:ATP-dependent Clp protease ATP-binding subunit ClpB